MPILDRPAIVWACLAYLALIVGIGLWAARRTRSARDFYLAGQSIGLVVTAFATMAAAFSGFVFIGGPGLTYRMGVASLFICLPLGFTAGLLCWVVARPLRLLAEVRETFTVPDALLARYGSRAVSGLAAAAVLVGTVAYLGAQLQALGVLIEAIFGTRETFGAASLPAAMAIGLAVVVFYSIAGGMIAGAYTDLVQGLLMVGAALGVFAVALRSAGGLGGITGAIAGSDAFGPAFLDPLGSAPVFTAMGFFFVFGVGTLGQPHMLHKFYMLDDPRKLRWLPAVLGGSQLLCVLVWLGIGLAVPALVATGRLPALERPDDAAPLFLLEIAPGLLAGVAVAAILAAIMSTADSFLNLGAAALVRDLPKALGLRLPDQLRGGRAAVLGLGVAAALFAWAYGDLVALLGTFAFSTFAAALAPAVAIGLHWRRVPAAAAVASITTGLILTPFLELSARWGLPTGLPDGVLAGAVSLAASFTVLFLVTWLWRRPSPIAPEMAAVMDS